MDNHGFKAKSLEYVCPKLQVEKSQIQMARCSIWVRDMHEKCKQRQGKNHQMNTHPVRYSV